MRRLVLPLALALNACTPATPLISTPETATRTMVVAPDDGMALPPMKSFGAPSSRPPRVSNRDLATDFIELSFRLESGRELPVFTRFEEPVTVALVGEATPVFETELDRLIARIRSGARSSGTPTSRRSMASATSS